jgi:hypothetical protein
MSSRLSLVTLSLVLVSLMVGCGGSEVFVRGDALPIDLTKEKILILPCDTWGFSGIMDETAAMGALILGVNGAFGSAAVDLNPLTPVFEAAGLKGMAYQLASGVYHCIDYHQSFDLNDACGKGIEKVPAAINQLVGLAMDKLGMSPKPTYIFALTVMSEGQNLAGLQNYRVIACIFDTVKNLVHSCVYYTDSTMADAMIPQMSQIPGVAFGKLMEKAAAPKAAEPAK